MASAERTPPSCPVCNRSDLVKTVQAAYNSGVMRCAPPDMPTRNVPMTRYIATAASIVGVCVFLIIVLIGGMGANFPFNLQLGLVSVTIISIIAALVVSYIAFQRVVNGDAEMTLRFPAWDKATETWGKLYYCSRDDVVFDPQNQKLVSNEQLERLRRYSESAVPPSQAALVSH